MVFLLKAGVLTFQRYSVSGVFTNTLTRSRTTSIAYLCAQQHASRLRRATKKKKRRVGVNWGQAVIRERTLEFQHKSTQFADAPNTFDLKI